MPSPATPSGNMTHHVNYGVEGMTKRQSRCCTASPTTWSSPTPRFRSSTSPSNCPSWPTHLLRPTCRNSSRISFVGIGMFSFPTACRPKPSRRCRIPHSARYFGTTSGKSQTLGEAGNIKNASVSNLPKKHLRATRIACTEFFRSFCFIWLGVPSAP